MDLKYVTNTQILEVQYEGPTRKFAVISVHPTRAESSDHLVDGLQILSLHSDSKPIVWIFGWDTVLRIVEAEAESQLGTTHKVLRHNLALSVDSKSDGAFLTLDRGSPADKGRCLPINRWSGQANCTDP